MIDLSTISIAESISEADKQTLRRVLVMRRGGIGDIILATPSLRMLASRIPAASVDLLVQRDAADAASGLPYIASIYEVDSRSNPVSLYRLRKLAQRLRDNCYDLVINFQPGAKTNYLATACRPRFLLTFQKDRSVQPETGQVRHAIDDFIQTLLPLKLGPVYDRSLDFVVPDDARRSMNALLLKEGFLKSDSRESLIVLNPTARRIVNRWPADRWARLLDDLCATSGCRVAVIGAGARSARCPPCSIPEPPMARGDRPIGQDYTQGTGSASGAGISVGHRRYGTDARRRSRQHPHRLPFRRRRSIPNRPTDPQQPDSHRPQPAVRALPE